MLATRRTLLATLLAPAAVAVFACSGQKKAEVPIQKYELRGEVVRLEPERDIAVIKHEKIDGWMDAMTMEFPVRDKADFAKLAEGKRIHATVYVQDLDYWIGNVHTE